MRLFIAIGFSDENRKILFDDVQMLRKCALQGNTTKLDNLHLTLAFIGDVPNSVYRKVCAVMDVMRSDCFELTFNKFGRFEQSDGMLYWIGAQKNPVLLTLQENLVNALKSYQIPVDLKRFKPHITMGRRMVMQEDFSEKEFEKQLIPVTQKVTYISLMKSERVDGKLVYTEVYRKKF